MTQFERPPRGARPSPCGLIPWGLWVRQGSNESRVATNRMLIAPRHALAEIGAGIRAQSAPLERQS
jgi:hypothetical protein